jgi:hypothetical protein
VNLRILAGGVILYVSVSQHSVVSSVKPYNLDSTSLQFRLNNQGREF